MVQGFVNRVVFYQTRMILQYMMSIGTLESVRLTLCIIFLIWLQLTLFCTVTFFLVFVSASLQLPSFELAVTDQTVALQLWHPKRKRVPHVCLYVVGFSLINWCCSLHPFRRYTLKGSCWKFRRSFQTSEKEKRRVGRDRHTEHCCRRGSKSKNV